MKIALLDVYRGDSLTGGYLPSLGEKKKKETRGYRLSKKMSEILMLPNL